MRGVYFDDIVICGFPCSTWVIITDEIYSIGGMSVEFHGWPDGQPLWEQEQCVVDLVKIVLTEMLKEHADGKTKQ